MTKQKKKKQVIDNRYLITKTIKKEAHSRVNIAIDLITNQKVVIKQYKKTKNAKIQDRIQLEKRNFIYPSGTAWHK